jgi:hypothetical protein
VEVSIPIIPDLRVTIDATPVVGATTYLVTRYGRGINQDEKSLTLEASPPPVREKVEKRRG